MKRTGSDRQLVATRLRPRERDAITQLAEANQRTVSGEVRRAILRHLDAEGAPPRDEGGGAT